MNKPPALPALKGREGKEEEGCAVEEGAGATDYSQAWKLKRRLIWAQHADECSLRLETTTWASLWWSRAVPGDDRGVCLGT